MKNDNPRTLKLGQQEIATLVGATLTGIKVSVHGARKRYRELLRAEVTQIVSDPTEVDDELRRLARLLSWSKPINFEVENIHRPSTFEMEQVSRPLSDLYSPAISQKKVTGTNCMSLYHPP